MPYSTRILRDSIGPNDKRLTTWELTYPRMVHAELMTHRLFSRNAASSRAIPNEKLRERVLNDPALPVWWGKNQSGMQAREELDEGTRLFAQGLWLEARNQMLEASEKLAKIGLHKQICNRLIEPWMFITVIVSATEWDNWYHLRDHKDAQPEIAWVAKDMYKQHQESVPWVLNAGEWHLPLIEYARDLEDVLKYIEEEKLNVHSDEILKKISVGRCARVSYLTHDGRRDIREDIKLHDKLISGMETDDPLHMSPFEHIAQALETEERSGNFIGWKQYRKEFPKEHYGGVMP